MEGRFLRDLDEEKADLLEPTYRGALGELDRRGRRATAAFELSLRWF